MPRIKQNASAYAAKDFMIEIRKAGVDRGLNSVQQIAEYCGLKPSTLRRRMREPEAMPMGEILLLSEKLHMKLEAFAPLARGGKTA